ncbi:hypothetical protein KSF78_0003829 [Schistosoma japonicum]|uniref:SJCHGC08408 protein n=1 Tax=Schistosoma japonicum TaxID=6182 RepID=Q5BRG2_SCHJA|nr:SJCHGC08408 protein [Schistosoma japonicum]KAH8867881.1 hypothetical protein KSF78_0003829 [Schistosoma japonicum]KAH8867882.1 hypothetical protein KSF78_0003829 [Schistosoma japonicum]KAH8867883.1 hypothetical protein KSF78_0003829 [Schistosoma japonicum]
MKKQMELDFSYNRKMSSEEFWMYIFRIADIDHNGKISKSEFKRYMDQYSGHLTSTEVEKAFKYCDLDNNGFIDFQEFKKYMKCE